MILFVTCTIYPCTISLKTIDDIDWEDYQLIAGVQYHVSVNFSEDYVMYIAFLMYVCMAIKNFEFKFEYTLQQTI